VRSRGLPHEKKRGPVISTRFDRQRAVGVTTTESPFTNGFEAALAPPVRTSAPSGFHESEAAVHRLDALIARQSGRIAAVLHDDVSQVLAAIHMTLEDIACDLSPAVQARLRDVRAHLHQIEEQLHDISRQLHPAVVEDFGLADAITFTVRAFTRRTGIPLALSLCLDDPCPPAAADVIFRVVQEALANIAAHACAASASLTVSSRPQSVFCAVCDDGIGFDSSAGRSTRGSERFGLQLIRARVEALGGTFEVESAPRQGTRLRANVPTES